MPSLRVLARYNANHTSAKVVLGYLYAKRTRLALEEGTPFASLAYLGAWKWPSVLLVTLVPAVAFLLW